MLAQTNLACCTLILLGLIFSPSGARSQAGRDKPPATREQAKSKKVWTNEDLGSLGGVNVVGRELPGAKNSGPSAIDRAKRPSTSEFTATSLDGTKYTSDSTSGNVVLIQFWGTYCAVCRRDQANVDKVSQHRKLVVLAVDTGETREIVESYLNRSPRAVPVVLSRDTNLRSLYPPEAVPTYVVLDREGNVAARHVGYAGVAELERMLASAGL